MFGYSSFLLVFLVFNVESSTDCFHSKPCKNITGGGAFVEPEVVKSTNGRLAYTLNVSMANFTFDWLTIHRRVYNGKLAGPTITVQQGDNVNITVKNNLLPPEGIVKHNSFQKPNATNLHTHGLHINSTLPSDDVFIEIPPRGNFTHVYQIEEQNPPGTYWYHAHLHGATMFHVQGGMSGLLIVEDPDNENTTALIRSVSCPFNCEHDIKLLFQPTLQYVDLDGLGFGSLQKSIGDPDVFRHLTVVNATTNKTLEDWLKVEENEVDYYTTNGLLQPVMNFSAGQTKRFRMVNAGGLTTLEMTIVDNNGVNACDFYEIAIDGVYLNKPRMPRFKKTLLVPAARVDWLVVCNKPGNYKLVSQPSPGDQISMGNFNRYNKTLLHITVTGSASNTAIDTTINLPQRPSYVGDFTQLKEDEVHGQFVIEANSATNLNRELFKTPTHYRYKIEVGKYQQWFLINTDHKKGHPMHIHVNHFQIISYNNYTGPYSLPGGKNPVTNQTEWKLFDQNDEACHFQHSGLSASDINVTANGKIGLQYLGHAARANTGAGLLGYSDIGDFRDTVLVPPLANITIRFLPHKFTGNKTIHCHILAHEDSGMMYVVDVVKPGESLNANVTSGNAYPGTCHINDPFPFNKRSAGVGVTTYRPLWIIGAVLGSIALICIVCALVQTCR
nr:uncharacterized protein LOC100183735 isoform X1 [Ciona intestinalis]XP_026691417.1 uncharacterized protein LOC100183735 isoform X1 [Ciona intestinalis]XP_026691418.1 uncharacterized protein LOC100183735 isoform X1 [Ciona intestinalis]XP_026691419.1 uncharacterized protein LOC100183735 isoform X1 [Ciona intestinalis]|eukprot:XP_018668543.1 uncharacterized protein LOC100183735 isoform X1 [Ciona intestinalis]